MDKRSEEMAGAIEEAERRQSEEDERPYVRPTRPVRGGQVYSVRIPVEKIEALRKIAVELEVQPSALMRQWVLERLDDEKKRIIGNSVEQVITVRVLHSIEGSSVSPEQRAALIKRIEDSINSAAFDEAVGSPARLTKGIGS